MKPVNWYFNRATLAENYLKSVGLSPIPRIALLGVRRIGKTAFLLNDIAPKAIELGFFPVYVNMWANLSAPQEHILNTFNDYIDSQKSGIAGSVSELLSSEVKKLDINLGIIKASVDTSIPAKPVPTSQIEEINHLLKKLVNLAAEKDQRLLFILDEIQHLNTSEEFLPVQACLRTQFDTFEDICVIYAGSSRGGVSAMFNSDTANFGKKQLSMPFYNSASLVDFPCLDEEFVEFYHATLSDKFDLNYSLGALTDCFSALDFSPFWFRMLVSELTTNRIPLADAMAKVNARIRLDGGLDEILAKMTALDIIVFVRIYHHQALYSKNALDEYSEQLKRKVNKGSVQNVVSKLKKSGVITEADNKFFIEKVGLYEILK
ncbi:MAG: hypothetical protein ACI8WB_002626 [Phenylobacterium sp.]|jgi:hypothetical protein